ncbi:hypothetical protein CMI47_19300 [Candidatus Pacearchaeota archaeon]|nr:hypothetical protein [Candidatus Pacearchaeota archaeon]
MIKEGDLVRFYNYDYFNDPSWEIGIVVEITHELPEENWDENSLPAAIVMNDKHMMAICVPNEINYGTWVEVVGCK